MIQNTETDGVTHSLTKVGTGTQTLSGANTYTGDTKVEDGQLNITNSVVGNVDRRRRDLCRPWPAWGGEGTIGGTLTFADNDAATNANLFYRRHHGWCLDHR